MSSNRGGEGRGKKKRWPCAHFTQVSGQGATLEDQKISCIGVKASEGQFSGIFALYVSGKARIIMKQKYKT